MLVLTRIAESEEDVGVGALARDLGLPPSTVHRLLGLLRDGGFVEWDPETKRYRPGQELARISSLVLRRNRVTDLVRPAMQRVVERCGETCLLGIYLPAVRAMMFADEVTTPHSLRFHVPKLMPLPLVWGCSGRVILAQLPPAEAEDVVASSGPSPVTGAPAPSYAEMARLLERIRREGHDHTQGEKIPDSIGVAAPLLGPAGVVGSLSITIPASRGDTRDVPALLTLISDAAREAGLALGANHTDADAGDDAAGVTAGA